MEEEVIICACHSFEHQAIFWYDKTDNFEDFYVYFHLTTHHNFFKRLWYGLKYAFGYKSRFGAWDEFIFDEQNETQLYNYLKERHGKR